MRKPTPIGEKRNHLTCLGEGVWVGKRYLIVKCDCGNIKPLYWGSFGTNHTCGCKFTIYDQRTNHSCYSTHKAMYERCYNTKHPSYTNYGGRGITVHPIFKDFWVFAKYVESLPNYGKPDYTLDRVNNNGHYEPMNLRWVTRLEQNLNRRKNKNNTSGYVGVRWDASRKKWSASIMIDHKHKHLGRYDCIEDAIAARKSGEFRYWGKV